MASKENKMVVFQFKEYIKIKIQERRVKMNESLAITYGKVPHTNFGAVHMLFEKHEGCFSEGYIYSLNQALLDLKCIKDVDLQTKFKDSLQEREKENKIHLEKLDLKKGEMIEKEKSYFNGILTGLDILLSSLKKLESTDAKSAFYMYGTIKEDLKIKKLKHISNKD